MVESEDRVYKIVIAGLDQAGKTSILNMLNQNYNLMDNIKPTVGVNRSTIHIFGIPIVNFDLGGQEKYREGYLTDPKYFEMTDSFFFVIDALHATRYEDAIYYYKKILKIFDAFGIKPNLVVLIHKIDPNIRNDPETNEMIDKITDLIYSNSEGYQPSIFITSIYDRKSIVQAFSKNLQELVTTLKPFKKVMKSLVYLLKLDGAILFDENLLIIGDYYVSEEIEQIFLETVYNSVFYIKNVNPQLAQNFTLNFEMILEFKNQEKRFNFIELEYKGWKLFLLTMGIEKFYSKSLKDKFSLIVQDIEKVE